MAFQAIAQGDVSGLWARSGTKRCEASGVESATSAAPGEGPDVRPDGVAKCLAWRRGLEATLAESPDDVVPYRIYGGSLKEMQIVARDRLRLFNGM